MRKYLEILPKKHEEQNQQKTRILLDII